MGLTESNHQKFVVSFGKANILQTSMLLLAGYVPVDSVGSKPIDVEQRLLLIRKARKALVARTSLDCGYDVVEWNAALLADDIFSSKYTSEYAWEFVNAKIENCDANVQDLIQLRQMLENEDEENASCDQ
jgi:hypothetical protein